MRIPKEVRLDPAWTKVSNKRRIEIGNLYSLFSIGDLVELQPWQVEYHLHRYTPNGPRTVSPSKGMITYGKLGKLDPVSRLNFKVGILVLEHYNEPLNKHIEMSIFDFKDWKDYIIRTISSGQTME